MSMKAAANNLQKKLMTQDVGNIKPTSICTDRLLQDQHSITELLKDTNAFDSIFCRDRKLLFNQNQILFWFLWETLFSNAVIQQSFTAADRNTLSFQCELSLHSQFRGLGPSSSRTQGT